jgi:uncharacterized protein
MSEPSGSRGTRDARGAEGSRKLRSGEQASPSDGRIETRHISESREARRERVAVTDEAAGLLRRLVATHGPVMFHQSGGCCDGSSPMCFPVGEFVTSEADVHLGDLDVSGIEPVAVWMSASQFAYWKHTHLTIDVVAGRGAGFSLEAPLGLRFLIRSRLIAETELTRLASS